MVSAPAAAAAMEAPGFSTGGIPAGSNEDDTGAFIKTAAAAGAEGTAGGELDGHGGAQGQEAGVVADVSMASAGMTSNVPADVSMTGNVAVLWDAMHQARVRLPLLWVASLGFSLPSRLRHCLCPCVFAAVAAQTPPLPWVSTPVAAKALSLSCVPTAFMAKTLSLPCVMAKTPHLPCAPTAFMAKTLPLSCVHTAFMAKTLPL